MANPFAAIGATTAAANPFAAAAAPAPAAANPFATAAAPAAANPFAAATTAAAANPFAAATTSTTAATTAAANPFAAATTTTTTAANPFAAATTTTAANPFAAATTTTAANPFAAATTAAAGTATNALGAVSTTRQEVNYDTPFNKLPPAIQAELNKLNASIHETDLYHRAIKQHSPQPLQQLRAKLIAVGQSVGALQNSLQQKSNAVQLIQKQVQRDQHHADMAHLVVRDFSSGFAREVQLPSPFFWQLLNQFEDRMERHANQIRLLEQMLLPHRSGRAVYDDDGAGDVSMMASEFSPSGQRLTPELLAKLLVAQHEAFTVLAGGKVSQVHSEVERLKEQYLRVVNDYAQAARGAGARSRSMREDPFRDQDRVEMEAAQRSEASRKIEVPVLAAPKPVASAAVPGATAANPFGTIAAGATAANPFATAAATTTAATSGNSRRNRRRKGRW